MTRVPSGISKCVRSEGMKTTLDQRGNTGAGKTLVQIDTNDLRATVSSVIQNSPLLIFFSAFLFAGLGLGMWLGLLFVYIDAYLDKGDIFAEIYLISCLIGVASAGFWVPIAKIIGKKYAWLAAVVLGMACFMGSGLLEPRNTTYFSLLILLAIKSLFFVGMESLPQSMLSDIVDYSTWKFGIYRGSTYFSIFLFVYKSGAAIGAALGLLIAGWYGFDPSLLDHTPRAIYGLLLAMAWVPCGFALISIIFITLSPITEKRHQTIRRRLDLLEARFERNKALSK